MKVRNKGNRPVWVSGIKIMPEEVAELPLSAKEIKATGFRLEILEEKKKVFKKSKFIRNVDE